MKKRPIIVGVMLVVSILAATFTYYFWQVFRTPNLQADKADTYLYIPTGATFRTVLDSLTKNKVLQDKQSFALLAKMRGYQDRVLPGRYRITKNMSNGEALRVLQRGLQTPVRITFNNARLKTDLAQKITANLEMRPDSMLRLLRDTATVGHYGFDTTTVMAMFIPNTYEVFWTIKPATLLARMAKEYRSYWTDQRRAQAKALGLTPLQVSVLASIVEAEQAAHDDEKPSVAGLYLNRLRQGMRLEADPTLIYALGDFSIRRVLNIHKDVDSPYNTYRNAGLPPGPINLPSVAALNAVLNPAQNDYLFMCAKEDFSGYHNFAKDLTQHNRNAALYTAALSARRIYK